MTIRDDVDRAIFGYQGDDLPAVTVGFGHRDAFCAEAGLAPAAVGDGSGDVEVIYQGLGVRPGVSPDTIKLVTGY